MSSKTHECAAVVHFVQPGFDRFHVKLRLLESERGSLMEAFAAGLPFAGTYCSVDFTRRPRGARAVSVTCA